MSRLKGLSVICGLVSVVAMAGSPQELSLLVDQAYGRSVALLSSAPNPPTLTSVDAVRTTGFGVRYGIDPWSFKLGSMPTAAGADFTYHPQDSASLTVSGANAGNYKYQYWAVGLHASTTCLVDLSAGLDLRSEQVKLDAISGAGGSTTMTRPWAKASVGHHFETGGKQVFFRLEGGIPLNPKNNGNLDSGDDARRSLAPSYQVGLNIGIGF